MRKIFSVFALSAIIASNGLNTTYASDIQKTSNFKVIFADSAQSDATQDDSTETMSIGELIDSVYSASSDEKFAAVSAYLQNTHLEREQFVNLVSGLKVAKLSDEHSDSLIGFYVSQNQAAYDFSTFRSFLKMLSDASFVVESTTSNIAYMMSDLYVEKNPVDYRTLKKLVKFLKANDMSRDLIDDNLLPKGVSKLSGSLDIREFKSLLHLMDNHYRNVQSSALMVAEYSKTNAAKLADPNFREALLDLEQTVPQDENLERINNLQFDARETLLYCEFEYFKSAFEKDLFFTWNKVIRQIRDNVDTKYQSRVVKTILRRNSHRLDAKHVNKMKKAFSI
ncbi:MAG: hypothetical protein KC646_06990 [Candidatus Cloacimonetes bacterium]|nr:hypothetical protein [Candidatus Cloacimonadota bacterium]